MDKEDIKRFKQSLGDVAEIVGHFSKEPLPCEAISRMQARRSIVASSEIKKGEMIISSDLTYKRPGTGIDPRHIEAIVGRYARSDIRADTLITGTYLNDIYLLYEGKLF